jgi:hypothetical protein
MTITALGRRSRNLRKLWDRKVEVVENESRKCDHGDVERQADSRSACRLGEIGDLVHSRAVCDHFDPLCGYAEGRSRDPAARR